MLDKLSSVWLLCSFTPFQKSVNFALVITHDEIYTLRMSKSGLYTSLVLMRPAKASMTVTISVKHKYENLLTSHTNCTITQCKKIENTKYIGWLYSRIIFSSPKGNPLHIPNTIQGLHIKKYN